MRPIKRLNWTDAPLRRRPIKALARQKARGNSSRMTFLRTVMPFHLFCSSMILSENRYPSRYQSAGQAFFRILL
jgi:hypothetical protein